MAKAWISREPQRNKPWIDIKLRSFKKLNIKLFKNRQANSRFSVAGSRFLNCVCERPAIAINTSRKLYRLWLKWMLSSNAITKVATGRASVSKISHSGETFDSWDIATTLVVSNINGSRGFVIRLKIKYFKQLPIDLHWISTQLFFSFAPNINPRYW